MVPARRDHAIAIGIALALFGGMILVSWFWVRPPVAHHPAPATITTLVADTHPADDSTPDTTANTSEGGPSNPYPPVNRDIAVTRPSTDVFTQAPQPLISAPTTDHSDIRIPVNPGHPGPGHGRTHAFEVGELERAPTPVSRPSPQYPTLPRVQGVEGQATIDFIVDVRGNVRDAYALSATLPEFGDSAVKAVSHWKFKPGIRSGRAVNVHMRVPIVFSLQPGQP
jgi:protein TonB